MLGSQDRQRAEQGRPLGPGQHEAELREIYGAPTRAAAEAAIDVFVDKYGAKYDKAVACLTKDREALLAFFDFPAEHWDHLRTSNPIESVFATVRHRTVRTKGAPSAKTAKLMVFKLVNMGGAFGVALVVGTLALFIGYIAASVDQITLLSASAHIAMAMDKTIS